MSVFKTDTDKKVNAQVVEGDGAISYAVKSGSENYIDVDASSGALTIKGVPSDNMAYVTATAAATGTYARTSVDVPIKIYETFEYEISFWTVQYAAYNRVFDLSSLDIKLFDTSGNEVGSTTVQSPKNGGKATVSATSFADKVKMTAHIQIPGQSFTLEGTGGIGGAINVWNPNSRSGKVFTCNYGMNAPDPDYAAPVAKTNLTANGSNQTLVYPGSVSIGGRIQYKFGSATEPGSGDWIPAYGYMRAKDPGTYYVWWRTHNRDYYSAKYIGQGRSEITSQQPLVVTIDKGDINPKVNIEGWTYGEKAKEPTVTGNSGNGAVTYSYSGTTYGGETYGPSADAPEQAGTYTVTASIAESKTHNAGSATADFTIAKAKVPTQDVRVMGVMSSNDQKKVWTTGTLKQSLAGMMPSDAGELRYTAGTPSYKVGESVTTLPTSPTVFTFTPTVNSLTGEVSATLEITYQDAQEIEGVDQVGEIILPVTVKSQKNYDDATINFVVMPTARTEQDVTIDGVFADKTYGDRPFPLTATVTDRETEVKVDTANGDWYWYSSDPSVLWVPEVEGDYTASETINVEVRGPGSAMILAWYEPSPGTTIGAALTTSITVNKAKFKPSVTLEGWTYGQNANNPSVSGVPEGVSAEINNSDALKVTYEYKAKDADDSTYTTAVPTLAGTYTVRATVPETTNYEGATCTTDFTIAQKQVTAYVIAQDKSYDGTTAATMSATVKSSDLVASDLDDKALVDGEGNVTVLGLVGTFADKNVGTGKTINLNYDGVISPVANAECYEVVGEMPTAKIEPRSVYVKADDKSSQYGEDIAALTCSLYGSTTLAEGDTIELLGITASTTATKSSSVGSYPITLSGGTANPNYTVVLGEESGTYTIAPADISKAEVTLAQTSYIYDGSAKEPAVTSVTLGGKSLVAGTDYDVSYAANVNVGTASATVTGKGNYTGSATAAFAIEAKAEPKPEPIPEPEPVEKTSTYRLYNPYSGEHFFTSDSEGRDTVVAAGWIDEGEGWMAPSKSDTPVYRLYNSYAGEHHFTLSADERDALVAAGWTDEGTGWYSDDAKAVPVLREYNPNEFSCNHNFTTSQEEHDGLVAIGWLDEGIAWYGLADNASGGELAPAAASL